MDTTQTPEETTRRITVWIPASMNDGVEVMAEILASTNTAARFAFDWAEPASAAAREYATASATVTLARELADEYEQNGGPHAEGVADYLDNAAERDSAGWVHTMTPAHLFAAAVADAEANAPEEADEATGPTGQTLEADIRSALADADLPWIANFEHTGGGCYALWIEAADHDENGPYVMVTDADDVFGTEDYHGPTTGTYAVGEYATYGDDGTIAVHDSPADMVAAVIEIATRLAGSATR